MTEWQTMDTAPKDGTRVMLWLRAPWSRAEIAEWDDDFGLWVERHDQNDEFSDLSGIGSFVPSHWHSISPPKPAAPSLNGGAHGKHDSASQAVTGRGQQGEGLRGLADREAGK